MNSEIQIISSTLTDIETINSKKGNVLQLSTAYQNAKIKLNLNDHEDIIIRRNVFVPYANSLINRDQAMLSTFTVVPSLTQLCINELNRICPSNQISDEDRFTAEVAYGMKNFHCVLKHYGYLR